MADMHHEIEIKAPPEKVYNALATQDGLRGWWTADSVAESQVGGTAEFGFGKRATLFRMRIKELLPNSRIVWNCVGNVNEWRGTELEWHLSVTDSGTLLRFKHSDWRSASGFYATCNTTWGMLLYRLKDYVEGKKPGPYWTE